MREATPLFALLGCEMMQKHQKQGVGREQETEKLMESDILGDSSKICLPAP